MLLRNVGLSPNYIDLQPRKPYSSFHIVALLVDFQALFLYLFFCFNAISSFTNLGFLTKGKARFYFFIFLYFIKLPYDFLYFFLIHEC
jgi:hypothetical protein